MAAMYQQYPSQPVVVSIGYPQQPQPQYQQYQQQQPPRGGVGGLTFCGCCHGWSPSSVRWINYCLAGVIMAYGGASLISLLLLSSCMGSERISPYDSCDYSGTILVFFTSNYLVIISGKAYVLVLATFGVLLLYITPGILMVVGAAKSHKPSAFAAIPLLGINIVANFIIGVYLASEVPKAGPFVILAFPTIVGATVNYILLFTLLLTAIFASLATVQLSGDKMRGDYGGGVAAAPSNMMDQRQSHVMSQIGSAQSSVRSNVVGQTAMSPSLT